VAISLCSSSLFAVRSGPPGPLSILAFGVGLLEFLLVLGLAGVDFFAALLA
jgi:hypothetical protein